MSKDFSKQDADNSSSKSKEEEKSEIKKTGRRAALAKAGLAGGAIAGGVWKKPSIDSTVLPAHAAMTAGGGDGGTGVTTAPPVTPITMVGPTGALPSQGSAVQSESDSLFAKVGDALVPSAEASSTATAPTNPAQHAFEIGTICVTLTFPQGNTPSGPVNVSVQGPPFYYTYYNGGYNFAFDYQISGAGNTTLGGPNGLDFSIPLGPITVEGCVDSTDFMGASGFVRNNSTIGIGSGGNVDEAYQDLSGYGSSFTATVGGFCTEGYGFLPRP